MVAENISSTNLTVNTIFSTTTKYHPFSSMKMEVENEGGDEAKGENRRKKKKDSQCYQHSSDAIANAQQQQPHALK